VPATGSQRKLRCGGSFEILPKLCAREEAKKTKDMAKIARKGRFKFTRPEIGRRVVVHDQQFLLYIYTSRSARSKHLSQKVVLVQHTKAALPIITLPVLIVSLEGEDRNTAIIPAGAVEVEQRILGIIHRSNSSTVSSTSRRPPRPTRTTSEACALGSTKKDLLGNHNGLPRARCPELRNDRLEDKITRLPCCKVAIVECTDH
jgi:hypothetical protein